MRRSIAIVAGVLPLAAVVVVALTLSAGASGRSVAAAAQPLSGYYTCQATACTSTMTNTSGRSIAGLYVGARRAVGNLAVGGDQAGANCHSYHGPNGEAECLFQNGHFWQPGATLTATFTLAPPAARATSGSRQDGADDGDDDDVEWVITFDGRSYQTGVWEEPDPTEEPCYSDWRTLIVANQTVAALEAFLQVAAEQWAEAASGFAAGATSVVHELDAIENWESQLEAQLTLAKAQVTAAQSKYGEDGCDNAEDAGSGDYKGALKPAAAGGGSAAQAKSPADCVVETVALLGAQTKASVLARAVTGYKPLASIQKQALAQIAKTAAAAKKAKGAAKAKLVKKLARMRKADTIVAAGVRKLAALNALAAGGAADATKAQAALTACQNG